MDEPGIASPFREAASYYDRFRPPYARAALEYIATAFGLAEGCRVIDLGCGPGTVAIPLSLPGAEVVAVDPDVNMLSEGRRLAAERGAGQIRWVRGRAEDVLAGAGHFRLATFGRSLHWMERDLVLRGLGEVILDGGGIAIIDESRHSRESWMSVAEPIIRRYTARTGRHPAKHRESDHEPSLRRSAHFNEFTISEFGAEFTRDFASVLGCIYSGVGISRAGLGDRVTAFEAELLDALARVAPSGMFHEKIKTAVFIAMKK